MGLQIAFIAILLLSGTQTWAQGLTCEQVFAQIPQGLGFIVPNEKNLGAALTNFRQIPAGAYVAVGSERGFISASVAPAVSALVLVDRDLRVVLFNQVNKALLALANDRQSYLQLRLHADFKMISESLALASHRLSTDDRNILSDSRVWQWWVQSVQKAGEWRDFHNPEKNDANYLHNDLQFSKITTLAKQNKIYSMHADFGSADFPSRIHSLLSDIRLPLAAFDLSNSWQQGYLGHDKTAGLLRGMNSILHPQTRLIFTYMAASRLSPGQTEFKYVFWPRQSLDNQFVQLNALLAELARQEPGAVPQGRTRMERLGWD